MSDERCELVEIVLVYVVVCGFDVVCLHGLPVKAALASHSGSDTANADDKLPCATQIGGDRAPSSAGKRDAHSP